MLLGTFRDIISMPLMYSFNLYVVLMPFPVLFALNSLASDIKIPSLAFFCFILSYYIFFFLFTFNFSVCMRRDPQNIIYLLKNCVFILTCLNFSHLQSTLHLMQYTAERFFSLLKTVFELVDFDAF